MYNILNFMCDHFGIIITICAPMIYTAPSEMFLMREKHYKGHIQGWAMKIKSFWGHLMLCVAKNKFDSKSLLFHGSGKNCLR